MPEVPHDATVALRLELGRMTDKANSLEAALRKEVLAIVREEIAKAKPKKMYDTKPDGTICIVAEDEEIAALKVDVEHVKFWNGQLKAENDRLRSQFANSEQENALLKAEVENFKEYLKWHADGHKFNAWEIWRRQQSDAGEGKPSV